MVTALVVEDFAGADTVEEDVVDVAAVDLAVAVVVLAAAVVVSSSSVASVATVAVVPVVPAALGAKSKCHRVTTSPSRGTWNPKTLPGSHSVTTHGTSHS